MPDNVQHRVERYVANNPDAGVMDVLGALTLPPEHRGLVKDILKSDGGTVADGTEADFTTPERGVWAAELLDREQWMGHVEKQPFTPWADRDHPDADEDEDARWKWGIADNYVDGETIAIAEDDPRLDGRVFLQQDGDPYAFVDGDDVRCPDTGEVHPVFKTLLSRLGRTYTDISTSGAGVHANYRGELPEGLTQATFAIDDEPWGANDELPEVEIYAGKHVCVQTGQHVPGTPTEIYEWDTAELRAVLDEHEQLPERHNIPTRQNAFDATEYTPAATDSDETTDDIRDVFAALDRINAQHVAAKTIVHRWNDDATTSDGNRAFVPTWGTTANGTANIVDDRIWQDTGGNGYGGPVVMALIDLGELDETATPSDARGELWFQGVDRLREFGYDIPEYVPSSTDDAEHTAILPPAVQDLTTTTSGWDWRHAGKHAGSGTATLTVEDARERTSDAIATAYERGDRVLIEALPTMGKSYGAIKAAADAGEPITVVTGRGHKEQYDQFRDWCEEHGLDHYTLPSFTRDCPTANGEHGDEWKATVRDWYARGATPQEIHKSAEYELDRPLPCHEHEGHRCPYASKWDFEPDDYDVLIGHYNHAYKSKVTAGRTVVFDEFPDAYETQLGSALQSAVSYWLECTDGVLFDSYTDLIENRDDQQRRADALLWFEEHGADADETHVFEDANAHADAPLTVFTLLASDDLGNGFEQATIDDADEAIGVFNRANGGVSILRPPTGALSYASGVVALDGTPTKRLWELALGGRLNHRSVLQDDERAEYIRDALNLKLVRTTEYVKPYNSASHVNIERDAALLEAIADQHGQRPSVITTATAEAEYDEHGVGEHVDETKHYGNVLGSNEFDDTRVGGVIGSNHYGDGYIKKWGAYAGEAVERNDGKGVELSYSGFGDDILQHMREHDTLQAVMRFGRDGNGAVVYVHTDTLPTFAPIAGEARVLTTWSDGMKDVVHALEDLGEATTAAIVEHPTVNLSRQQVFAHLETLRERGVLTRQQDETDGRRVVWLDDGIHRLGEHGDVELEPIELAELDEDEVRQLARSSLYTWEFTNFAGETVAPTVETSDSGRFDTNRGDDPPPDTSHAD